MKKKGFTLIELIVVIAILGILASVLIPKFTAFSYSAHINSLKTEAKEIYNLAAAQYAEKGEYPKDTAGFANLMPNSKGTITKGGVDGALFSYKVDDYTAAVSDTGIIKVYDKNGNLAKNEE